MSRTSKTIIRLVIVIMMMLVILTITFENDKNIYNDGICSNCGGTYRFKTAAPHSVGKSGSLVYYIYECENCHHLIELHTLR